jgi:hypothetical protein
MTTRAERALAPQRQIRTRGDGLGPHPALSRGEREFKKRGPPGGMGFFGPATAGPQNDSVS